MHVIKGKQNAVLEYDFTPQEARREEFLRARNAEVRRIMEFKQVAWDDKEKNLQREYSYFHPNREFSGKEEDQKWKKVDDGTFIDNGYR